MNHPSTWQELVIAQAPAEVFTARSFRTGNPEYIQFSDESQHEYIAVHTLRPYGDVDLLPTDVQTTLLPVEDHGEDYSLIAVPRDILPLKQATFGNGMQNVLELKEAYRQMGLLAGKLAAARVSRLTLDDFGIHKRTGEVVTLPPVEVGGALANDRRDPRRSLKDSLNRSLHHLSAKDMSALIDELDKGMAEADSV